MKIQIYSKVAQIIGIFILLFLILTIGLKGTFDGYYGFYHEDGKYNKPIIYTLTEKIIAFPPISFFMAYTGFDTGYGFFAPNVASDFVLLFEIYDKNGQLIEQRVMPNFKNKESVVRYTSAFNMFLDKIPNGQNKTNNQYDKYLDIIIKQITRSVLEATPQATHIISKLYLYDYPTIEAFKKGDTKEKVILLSEFKI